MYDIFYNFLASESMLNTAMSYESAQVICRYMSMGLTFAVFFGLIFLLVLFFKIIIRAFKG